jgi:pimeloyl-ACP methyl ester carboxylesterase
LAQVTAPTLLLIGSNDEPVIEMNQAAYQLLRCPTQLTIIPGATHLFEEPGTVRNGTVREPRSHLAKTAGFGRIAANDFERPSDH